MLTFEEFFHKKKIDLAALQAGQPALYAEFSKHYAAMGEKSFDHTKKFWFNKLRKDYLLDAGEPAPVPEKPLSVSDEVLKPKSTLSPVDAEGDKSAAKATSAKPAGFKPRFKAGSAKSVAPEEVTPVETTKASDAEVGQSAKAAQKPTGFKPKFKAGVTKPKAGTDVPAAQEEGASILPEKEASGASSAKSAADVDRSPASGKPAGFKPRFKAAVAKAKADDAEPASVKRVASREEVPEEKAETAASPEEISEKESTTATSNKPTGFKPRFKAGVTKPSKPKDDQ